MSKPSKLDRSGVFTSMLGGLSELNDEAEQRSIPLDSLEFNPAQPRKYLDTDTLAALTESVRQHGVLEPILVRRVGERHELIAGERRVRAAREADLETIPAVILEVGDHEVLELAVMENLQREDLNPIEETDAVLKLLSLRLEKPVKDVIEDLRGLYDEQRNRLGNTRISKTEHAEIGKIFATLGRFTPASFYTNRIPLLSLPSDLLEAVRRGGLHYPKAKMLARVKDPKVRKQLSTKAVKEGLSREALKELIAQKQPKPAVEGRGDLLTEAKRNLTKKRLNALEASKRRRAEKLLGELIKLLEA